MKKSRRKKTVWILGHAWTVDIRPKGGSTYADGSRVAGYCAFEDQEIGIAGTQSVTQQRSTLMHEIKHAITRILYGSGLSQCVPPDRLEEFLVRGLEVGEYAVYSDPRNKWLTKFVYGRALPRRGASK